jgi:hypothetical protein
MLLYSPGRVVIDLRLPPNETYGWVIVSIPWKGQRFGLTVTTDGWWFLGFFRRIGKS